MLNAELWYPPQADDFKSSPPATPQFCILHSAFSIIF